MLLLGVTIFLAGSALSGLAWSMESLILFRGIQGVGAGAIFPVSLAVIGDLFSPRERGRYQGLFGAVFGVAAIMGPLLGGWLTDSVGWHWIFYVNLPIGAVVLYIIYRFLPSLHGERPDRKLDYLGAVVFTVAVTFLHARPDEQAGGRLDEHRGRRLPAHRGSRRRDLPAGSSPAPPSRSSRSTCSATAATR